MLSGNINCVTDGSDTSHTRENCRYKGAGKREESQVAAEIRLIRGNTAPEVLG